MWPDIGLDEVFQLTYPPLQLVLRGTLIFWFLFVVFRFVLRRDVGSMGITDFLFVVLLGDAAQNGMIGEATSTSDAAVLICTLVFWNWLIDWATSRSTRLERFIFSQKLLLVRDGRMNRRHMRREFISTEELYSKVREEGIESLEEVHLMYLEPDGQISLIRRHRDDDAPKKNQAKSAPNR
jgi:uncharacterized membrane protein YcaP (DUF421 family)